MAKELEDVNSDAAVQGTDPFSPETAPAVNLIVSMRIYDALMALLQATDEEAHDMLNALHESGKVAWSLPWISLSESEGDTYRTDEDPDYVPRTP